MIVYRELRSVERDLDIPAKTLYSLSNSLQRHYRPVRIPKRDGSMRRLYVPDEALKRVQRAIAEKLLSRETVSCYATAYKPASGILRNAKAHAGRGRILKLDIYRFFDSIRYSTVKEKVFPKEKYSESIRILLSMLCYYKDVLPQGAPASPVISNIIMREFDSRVGEFCLEHGIIYTRYCDDMTFSGKLDDVKELISFVSTELKPLGLILNKRKTRLISSSSRQTVTGIVVNEKTNISDDYKRNIRKEVYFIRKFGAVSHLERAGYTQSPEKYLMSLLGKINFVLSVCPEDEKFAEYRQVVSEALKTM